MFEAYRIGVTLTLKNEVSPQLAAMSKQFIELDKLAGAVGRALKAVAQERAGFAKLAADGDASARALDKAANAATRLEARLAQVRATAGSLRGVGTLPALGGGGAGGGRGGGGHRNGFHGGNIHMGPGGIGVGTVGMAAGDAFLPLAAGMAATWAGKALYDSAKDLDTERTRFKLLGLSAAQNADAFRFVDGMRVYGSTRAENMRNFREAQGVFRESGESDVRALAGAKIAAPVLSQLNFLAESMGGEKGAAMAASNMAMLRYVELSGGLKDAATFNSIANWAWKLNQSSGGTVDWPQLLAFKKTAGAAGYQITEDGLAHLEPLMAELSGGRAGTADMTSFNRVTGKVRLPNQIAHLLVDSGIWNKNSVVWNAQGGIKRMKGDVLGAAQERMLTEDPEQFYERVIRPVYAKMKLDSEHINDMNVAIFGRTGGAFFSAIERNLPVIQKSLESTVKALDIAGSVAQAQKSLSGQEKEFDAAWTDFKTQFGTTALPFFSGILKAGSAILRFFGDSGDKGMLARSSMGMIFNPLGTVKEWGSRLFSHSDSVAGPNGPHVATANTRPIDVNAVLNMDGHKVASVVFRHVERELTRPQTGGSQFDPTMALLPAGG